MNRLEEENMLIEDMTDFTHDPLGFVLYSFEWGKNELNGHFGPEEWQQEVLTDIGDKLKAGEISVYEAIQIAVASGHGIGKSTLVAWIILWSLATHEDTRGIVTANTETQLKTKTWAELAKWYRLFIAKHWFEFTATAIYSRDKEHEKTWRFDMIPWSEHKTEAFAGMHNKGKRIVVIFDEASAIPDVIWEVTEGALTDADTEIIWIAFGNPTRSNGRFHDCFAKLKHRWFHKQVDSRSVKISNKVQINKWIEDYGEDSDFCLVRVRGEFPNVSDRQFIPTDIVEKARGLKLREEQFIREAVVIGVDPAWSGSDETVIFLRQGLMSKMLAKYRKLEDDALMAGYIAKFEDEYNADAVFVDFGYGTGIVSFGKQMGRKWVLVPFGSESANEAFANKRGEIWGSMKQWLKDGGSIPDDNDLANELVSPEHYIRTVKPHAGKIIIESKEDMKDRNLPSPNRADALALTFSFPVLNKSQRQFTDLTHKSMTSGTKGYDPLVGNDQEKRMNEYNPLSPLAQV